MSEPDSDISFEEVPIVLDKYPRTENVICRFGRKIHWSGGVFNKKTLTIAEGTPLPEKFTFCSGQFTLVVGNDLSITFNGEKLPESLIKRIPVDLGGSMAQAGSVAYTAPSGQPPFNPVQGSSRSDVFEDSNTINSHRTLTGTSCSEPGPTVLGPIDMVDTLASVASPTSVPDNRLFVIVDQDVPVFGDYFNQGEQVKPQDRIGMVYSCEMC
jgi:hypothetical protein